MRSKIRVSVIKFKINCETIGFVVFIVGLLVLIARIILFAVHSNLQFDLLVVAPWLLSFGLGFMAIGISAKSDKRYTDILTRMDTNIVKVLEHYEPEDKLEFSPGLSKNVVIKPPVATAYVDVATRVEVTTSEISKAKAQARLDADIKKVGFRRGELFQKEDGSWAVSWGGKYQL